MSDEQQLEIETHGDGKLWHAISSAWQRIDDDGAPQALGNMLAQILVIEIGQDCSEELLLDLVFLISITKRCWEIEKGMPTTITRKQPRFKGEDNVVDLMSRLHNKDGVLQ